MMRTSVYSRLGVCLLSLTLAAAMAMPAVAAGKGLNSPVAAAESRDPGHWFQKGALCATYGNNQTAVAYFGKALALDPGHSGAYFSRGVSYGQLGDFARGLDDINRAIEMQPRNGLYYYGRARVHLLAGDREKAMQDFRKAADLGDEDAQAYLKTAN